VATDQRRGVGRHRAVVKPAVAEITPLPLDTVVWELDYRTRSMRRAERIDLRFLRELDHGASLVNGFWSRYGRANYAANTLMTVVKALARWEEFCRETTPSLAHAVASDDLLRAFMAWIARRGTRRRGISVCVSLLIECLAEAANLESPGSGDALRHRKSELLLWCGGQGRRAHTEGKALVDADWQRLLSAARRDVETAMHDYQPGDEPTSGTALVPFIVMVAAYTGANTTPLLAFQRDAWTPAPVLDGYWSVTWRKDRAKGREEQSLVFAHKVADGLSLIEVLDFMRKWTEPLVARVPKNCRNDLWLHRSRRRFTRSAAWRPRIFLKRHAQSWLQKHGLKGTLERIRPSAALTLLRSGKALTHVQHFLQHADLRTTWKYVRSAVLHPTFNRVIAATQERILGHVLPQSRASAAVAIEAPRAVHEALVSGAWDLGTCACRDPYHSPIPGEITGRLCRSFHACYTCPHAVWFKEHLPLEVWKLRRFESLRESDPHWSRKYQTTCEMIRRDILGAFGADDRAWAEREASDLASLPILAASGVTL
jgi:hypothetical protein